MNIIQEFSEIPDFIRAYMIIKPELETLTHEFCKSLTNMKFKEDMIDHKPQYTFDIDNNETIIKFAEFYIEKSKLDYKYNCVYEDEIDMPKSIINEFFVVLIDNQKVYVYIDSFSNKELVLKAI